MKFANLMTTGGEWLRGEGPHHQIVISSRVRLARNLRQRAFPGWAKKAERTAILELIKPRVEELPEMQDSFSELLQDLSALEKQVLVERHLISREHAAKSVGQRRDHESPPDPEHHDQRRGPSADAVDPVRPSIEERIQTGRQGGQHTGRRNSISPTTRRLGYLTACPTNVGTGHARVRDAASARPGPERNDQSGHPGRE